MARLPAEQVERLKQEISLLRLVESQGHVPKRQGKDWVMTCPFHSDKTPSLVISPDSNLWHCLGACGVGGSVIDWVMKTQGVSFRYACEILQHDIGLVAGSTHVVKQATAKKLPSPLAADDPYHQKWTMPLREWKPALNRFMIEYGDRVPELK